MLRGVLPRGLNLFLGTLSASPTSPVTAEITRQANKKGAGEHYRDDDTVRGRPLPGPKTRKRRPGKKK